MAMVDDPDGNTMMFMADRRRSATNAQREEAPMPTRPVAASATYRFTIDVQAELYAEPGDLAAPGGETGLAHHRALVEALMARPDLLDRLLRSSAIDALGGRAQEKLSTQGWGGMSEQDLLRLVASGLDPGTLDYLREEVEDGVAVLLFDGYGAGVRRLGVEEIGGEAKGR